MKRIINPPVPALNDLLLFFCFFFLPKAVGDMSCMMARYPSAGYRDTRDDEVGLSAPTQAWLLGPAQHNTT